MFAQYLKEHRDTFTSIDIELRKKLGLVNLPDCGEFLRCR